jgi:hypothetical protein
VSAQGVTESGWCQVRTDEAGHYRLLVPEDSYNIWSEVFDRIPIAVDSVQAKSGEVAKNADTFMVNGGVVFGKYIDAATGSPVVPLEPMWVAHYGPARPRSGAAVTSTVLESDGSYRLRVAPGENYIYIMGGQASANVHVEEGKDIELNLTSGNGVAFERNRAGRIPKALMKNKN